MQNVQAPNPMPCRVFVWWHAEPCHVQELMGKTVTFLEDCVGEKANPKIRVTWTDIATFSFKRCLRARCTITLLDFCTLYILYLMNPYDRIDCELSCGLSKMNPGRKPQIEKQINPVQ